MRLAPVGEQPDKAIERAVQDLANRLRQGGAELDQVLLSGSCRRHTAVALTEDVDLLLVLGTRSLRSVTRRGPEPCLMALSAAMERAYPMRRYIRVQNRSIRLQISTAEPCFDLVPAFRHPCWPHVYVIPDRRRDSWILTCPEAHARIHQDLDRRTRHRFNPVIRALKSWNHAHGKLLSSFHIEALTGQALVVESRNLWHRPSSLLETLAEVVMQTCPDPAAVGPAIDEDVGEAPRRSTREALLRTTERLEAARRGRPGEWPWTSAEMDGKVEPS